jgi:hypothetical protein
MHVPHSKIILDPDLESFAGGIPSGNLTALQPVMFRF